MIGNLASQFRPSGHKLTTSKGLKQLTINSKPPTLNLETSKQHSLFAELECLLSGPQATKQTKTLPTSILKHEPLGMQAKKVILAQHYFNTTEMQQYTQTKKKQPLNPKSCILNRNRPQTSWPLCTPQALLRDRASERFGA